MPYCCKLLPERPFRGYESLFNGLKIRLLQEFAQDIVIELLSRARSNGEIMNHAQKNNSFNMCMLRFRVRLACEDRAKD